MHIIHPCHRCRNLPLTCSQLLQSKNILWTHRIWLGMCQAMQSSSVGPVSTPEVTTKVVGSVLRCSLSGLKHIQAFWTWALGTLPPMQQQEHIMFPFGGRRSLCLIYRCCPEPLIVQQLNQALHSATNTCTLPLLPWSPPLLLTHTLQV